MHANSISGVDLSIKRIELAYDSMSRVLTTSSYDAGSGGNVVNQVEFAYNSWGLVGETKQEHDGAVDGSTPSIVYTFDDGAASGEAKYVRLAEVDYPGGEDVFYIYPSSGIGDALSRVEAIADNSAGTTRFAQYTYLGAGTIVTISHPQVTYGLILSYGSSGDYSGWDRFGRIVTQKWTNTSGTALDHETYEYDRNSNMTSRSNELHSALDETYSYDGLDRLSSMTRDGSAYQSWTLDGTGNWTSFTDQGNTETRTHNEANEITAIDSNSVTYDEAGNLTQGPKPAASGDQVYVYDGWNRLIQVKETGGSVIVTYEYDSRGNRIEKTVGSDTYDYFHNEASQVVEVRLNDDTDPLERFVWDIGFVDTLVTAIRDTDTNGTIDQRAFYLWDATRNTTAITFASWSTVAERIHYDAYGKAQFYTASWSTKSGTSYGVVNTFTGRELDTESGLYYFRARYYDPALGRFISRDPLGYVNGMSLYRAYFVQRGVDPSGLRVAAFFNGVGYTPTGTPGGFQWPQNLPHGPVVMMPPVDYRSPNSAPESVLGAAAEEAWNSTVVKIAKGFYSLFTGDAGRAIGDRAVTVYENNTGEEFTGSRKQWGGVGLQLVNEVSGVNAIAEGMVGFDQAEERTLEPQERVAPSPGALGRTLGGQRQALTS